MKFCKQCGNQIDDAAQFCGKCGSPQSADASTQPQQQYIPPPPPPPPPQGDNTSWSPSVTNFPNFSNKGTFYWVSMSLSVLAFFTSFKLIQDIYRLVSPLFERMSAMREAASGLLGSGATMGSVGISFYVGIVLLTVVLIALLAIPGLNGYYVYNLFKKSDPQNIGRTKWTGQLASVSTIVLVVAQVFAVIAFRVIASNTQRGDGLGYLMGYSEFGLGNIIAYIFSLLFFSEQLFIVAFAVVNRYIIPRIGLK